MSPITCKGLFMIAAAAASFYSATASPLPNNRWASPASIDSALVSRAPAPELPSTLSPLEISSLGRRDADSSSSEDLGLFPDAELSPTSWSASELGARDIVAILSKRGDGDEHEEIGPAPDKTKRPSLHRKVAKWNLKDGLTAEKALDKVKLAAADLANKPSAGAPPRRM